jgi:DNA helicase HerA-like ATPase
VTTSIEFPPLDEEGQLVLILEEILEVRERRLRSKSYQRILDQVERLASRGRHLGGRSNFATSQFAVAWGQTIL